jgi:hypothetical protein
VDRRGSVIVSDDEKYSHVSRITKNENEIPRNSGSTSMKNPLSPVSNNSPRVHYATRNKE